MRRHKHLNEGAMRKWCELLVGLLACSLLASLVISGSLISGSLVWGLAGAIFPPKQLPRGGFGPEQAVGTGTHCT